MAEKLTTCLWLDDQAEEMVGFYKEVFKENFKEGDKSYFTTETPSNKPIGSLLTYEFEIFGRRFMALNGGPEFKFNEAVSFVIDCDDQEEVDYYWEALSAVPKSEVCGWLKDKFGVSWQINPKRLNEMIKSDDKEAAKRAMDAMLKMKKLVIADLEKAYNGQEGFYLLSQRHSIWAKGKVDGDTMENYWEWYRRDGTFMRSGYFKNGVQTGKWTTYDKNGKPYKVTPY